MTLGINLAFLKPGFGIQIRKKSGKPDRDLYKYESFTKNSAAQMYALIRALKAKLQQQKLNIPIFAVASADDKTVKAAAIAEFMSHQTNPCNSRQNQTRPPPYDRKSN